MYYACDVLQDAIRCSGGSSRATAAATSAGAHSHVGGMSGHLADATSSAQFPDFLSVQ